MVREQAGESCQHNRRMNYRLSWLRFSLCFYCPLAQEWTRFRGPNGLGISAEDRFPNRVQQKKSDLENWLLLASLRLCYMCSVFLTAHEKGKLYRVLRFARPASRRGAFSGSRPHRALVALAESPRRMLRY